MPNTQEKTWKQMVMDLCEKYKNDVVHASFVEGAALKIFDSLKKVHKYGHSERIMLSHAAILHDIGALVNSKKHHQHSKYLIDKDAITAEYPERERNLVSYLVYNHRKKIHKDVKLLDKKERDLVLKLSAILRVADSLDYNHEEVAIKNITLVDSEVKIEVEGVLPERISGRLQQKKELFNEMFKMDISLH